MAVNVAIMGFGRIGRDCLRAWALDENPGFEITHVCSRNLTQKIEPFAHLFKYDTIYRKFPGEVKAIEDGFLINGKKIKAIDTLAPEDMNYDKLGIDIVIDSTGAFREREAALGHIRGGAKKVIVTAPVKGEDITIVMGVNEEEYDHEKHQIISNASCTTNCLAPVTKVILDNFGIERGLMTTVHAYTNDQKVHDAFHKDLRRARMAAENIIPTTTGAAKAVGKVIPEVDGILTGMAMRVPVPTGSLVDVTYEISKDATAEEINKAIKEAAEGPMKSILEYSEEDLVSTDIIGNDHSAIFDSKLTTVMDRLVKCIAWYDNEWGYSKRVLDLTKFVAQKF
ncbi:MAG: type I glyceraldehyde-3-phosphate dehydrogenase [Peptoniphilus sp.]|nr:type I glyceraldehyde-3-phosphate dehydrogenase [Peptoniphilus sp.]